MKCNVRNSNELKFDYTKVLNFNWDVKYLFDFFPVHCQPD